MTIALVLSALCASDGSSPLNPTARGILTNLRRELELLGNRIIRIIPSPQNPDRSLPGEDIECIRVKTTGNPRLRWFDAFCASIQTAYLFWKHDAKAAHLFGFYTNADGFSLLLPHWLLRIPYVISRQTLPAQTLADPPGHKALWLRRLYSVHPSGRPNYNPSKAPSYAKRGISCG